MNVLALVCLVVAAFGLGLGMRRILFSRAHYWPAYAPGALCLALPTAIFITTVAMVGRLFRNFDAGLVAAALVGIGVFVLSRRFDWTDHPADRPTRRENLWFDAALLGVAILYAVVAHMYQMHDEHPIFGHKSMVEQLRYGEYPIYLPPIPAQDARYHYGFDILAGAVARAFGFSSDTSIDIVTVFAAVMLSWLAAALVSDAKRQKIAPFAAVAIHLGAGLAWVMLAGVEGRHPRCLLQYHHPSCGVELYPTPFLNIFQHPVSIGVPLLFTAILLARRVLESDIWRHAALLLLVTLPALAVGQFVYFALGSIALCSVLPVWLHQNRRWESGGFRKAGLLMGIIMAGFLLAFLAGGMLTPSEVTDPNLVVRRSVPGFPKNYTVLQILRHHAINLGIGFVLIPLFAVVALRRRTFIVLVLLSFAIGGIIVPHFWNYTRSWDIVKFPSASAFALTMVYVIVVDAALETSRREGLGDLAKLWFQRTGRAALLGSGIVAATFVAFPLEQKWRLYNTSVWKVDPIIGQTIEFWRSRPYDRSELIYAQSNIATQLAVFGGLSVVGGDYDFQALGIRSKVLHRQRMLRGRVKHTMDEKAIADLGIRWVMFSGQELHNLGIRAKAALKDTKRFELVFTSKGPENERTRKIWRVK